MSDYQSRLNDVKTNPALMLDVVYDELDAQLNQRGGNYDVPNAGSPFAWAMENATYLTCLALDENEAILQRAYPRLAKDETDLYHHMSDRDYLGRFSQPASCNIQLILSREEVLGKVVSVPGTRYKRLTIPRLTQVTVGGYVFTMQYPVHIDLMSHGGLQITFGNDQPSPLMTLTSNIVKWSTVSLNNQLFLMLDLPFQQMALMTKQVSINAAAGYKATYPFDNGFFFARVYGRVQGRWVEINTTHSDQVYDHRRLTALLTVDDGRLTVEVPTVYFTQRMVPSELRVDIYTTRGEIDVDLSSFDATQFEARFNDLDDDSTFVAPLNSFNALQAISRQRVTGGADPVDFDTLRRQVIYNGLTNGSEPVTMAQLNTLMERRGYRLVNLVDNITDREFIAIRSLPGAEIAQLNSPLGSMVGTLQDTLVTLQGSKYVRSNGLRSTLMPQTLYEYVDGKVVRCADYVVDQLLAMSPEARVTRLNQRRYLYTPFHYVLDGTQQQFDVRPYYLSHPRITSQTFVDMNASTEMQIGIEFYEIEVTDTGYRLLITTTTGERAKLIPTDNWLFQLSYLPRGEKTYASMNGKVVGGEPGKWLVAFDITTNYDISSDDYLRTLNFSMFDDSQVDFFTPLEGDFDLTFMTLNQDMRFYDAGYLDTLITPHLLPENTDVMVVSRERLTLHLGSSLRQLYRRGRTVPTEENYQRYTENVPAVYQSTEFVRDQDGSLVITMDDNGNVGYEIIHRQGDPILDQHGNPVYQHLKGDVVLGADGEPQLVESRKLKREYSLLMMDGLYYFATDQLVVDYRESIGDWLADQLEVNINEFQANLRERTDLYLHPTTTFGDTTVEVNQDERRTLPLSQSISVEYYLTPSAYSNVELRTSLSNMTHQVVSALLEEETVATSRLTTRLREEAGSDVVEVRVTGLGTGDTPVISVIDDSTRLTLGKRATVLPNMDITIQDDLDIMFLRHR